LVSPVVACAEAAHRGSVIPSMLARGQKPMMSLPMQAELLEVVAARPLQVWCADAYEMSIAVSPHPPTAGHAEGQPWERRAVPSTAEPLGHALP